MPSCSKSQVLALQDSTLPSNGSPAHCNALRFHRLCIRGRELENSLNIGPDFSNASALKGPSQSRWQTLENKEGFPGRCGNAVEHLRLQMSPPSLPHIQNKYVNASWTQERDRACLWSSGGQDNTAHKGRCVISPAALGQVQVEMAEWTV